ncbi:MAG: endonuclease/exonuclease/phosphatase family protein [Acidimicrobiales bacterium]
MRLASFNLLHGGSLDGRQLPLERLVAACASLQADVLCLQEVDRGQARSGGADQTAAIAEGIGAAAWRFQPALVGEPGGRWRPAVDEDDEAPASAVAPAPVAPSCAPSAGAYGVGLVSRLPVRAWHVVRLRAAPVRSPVYVPGARASRWGAVVMLADEPRVVVAAEVESPAGVLVVASTHLSFVPGWNAVQLRRATRHLAGLRHPCVLLGDLNLPGPVPCRVSGWRALASVHTFPADRPRIQLDHALARGPLPPVVATTAPRLDVSDHRALVVDLQGPAGASRSRGAL